MKTASAKALEGRGGGNADIQREPAKKLLRFPLLACGFVLPPCVWTRAKAAIIMAVTSAFSKMSFDSTSLHDAFSQSSSEGSNPSTTYAPVCPLGGSKCQISSSLPRHLCKRHRVSERVPILPMRGLKWGKRAITMGACREWEHQRKRRGAG